ncbi:hypothetical protein GC176_12280 [bacterium]|nr:hypothetical protein [bacterium]
MTREVPDSRPVHLRGARKVADLSKGHDTTSRLMARALPGMMMPASVPAERFRVTLVLHPESRGVGGVEDERAGAAACSFVSRDTSLSELANLYAPADADIELVRMFAEEHHLDVVDVSNLRHDVVLEGTAADLSAAFKVQLAQYEHDRGSYRAHDEAIHLPDELVDKVEAVLGLDDIPCYDRNFAAQLDAMVGTGTASGLPLMNPLDVADYYQFPEDSKGAGQRIAILEFGGGFYLEDINRFLKELGLSARAKINWIGLSGGWNQQMDRQKLAEITEAVNQDGEAAIMKYGSDFGEWSHMLEVTMDIELVAALAPEAEIDVYFVGGGTQEFRLALYALAGDRNSAGGQDITRPTVITDSWGKTESGYKAGDLNSLNDPLKQLHASGITVCCASGDFGSVGLPPNPASPATCANVCFPASSPYVLACGGTILTDQNVQTDGEVAWNEHINGFHLASTGGISGHFNQPEWQSDANVPSPGDLKGSGTWLSPSAHSNPDFRGRGVPDVAASADLAKGYRIILGGVATAGGGTSAAAPLWASLLACINQKCGASLSNVNARLYQAIGTNAFRQAMSGDNCVSHADIPFYSVRAQSDPASGWNACTGLGSPVGTMLIEFLSDAGIQRIDSGETAPPPAIAGRRARAPQRSTVAFANHSSGLKGPKLRPE